MSPGLTNQGLFHEEFDLELMTPKYIRRLSLLHHKVPDLFRPILPHKYT